MAVREHIHALTGLRGVASLWVLLHHTPNLYPLGEFPPPAPIQHLIEKGWLGVDLFFVLSGFVISFVYASELARPTWPLARNFLVLRLARIYPAHLVATLAFVPVYLGAHFAFGYRSPNDAFSLSKFAYSLTLTNGWGIPGSSGWNLPSWSVSSEWSAYLCFPLLAPALTKLRGFGANAGAAAGVIMVMVAAAAVINQGQQFILPDAYTLTRIGSEFLIGCFVFNIYAAVRANPAVRRGADPLAVLTGGTILGLILTGLHPAFDWVLVTLFALLVLCLALAVGPASRLFSSRTAVYLGEISYSVYLIHTVLLLLLGQALQRLLPTPATLSLFMIGAVYLLFVSSSLVAGHVLFHQVEEPARRRLRDRFAASTTR